MNSEPMVHIPPFLGAVASVVTGSLGILAVSICIFVQFPPRVHGRSRSCEVAQEERVAEMEEAIRLQDEINEEADRVE
jgi:hypothetical protein